MTSESSPLFAQLRQRMAKWFANFRPTPRTYITAACVGAAVGQYAALAGSADPLVAVTTLGAQLGVNLLADIIGNRPAPATLTIDEITAALQERMDAGDNLPAVRKLIEQFDLVKLALETWKNADDERFQNLLGELRSHPQFVASEVVDALDPRLIGLEQTTGEILRIVKQIPRSDGTAAASSPIGGQLPALVAANPFGDVGRITNPVRFWGREELLRRIFEELDKGVNLSLVGEAQIGKSSVLSMIHHYGPQRMQRPMDGFIYLSLEEVDDEDEFYAVLCERLGIETCRGYKLTRALHGQRYVLCIDEVEKLGWEQFGFTRKVRSHLRGLADGASAPFTLVVASRSPLAHVFPDSPELDSPLAGICHQIDVGPFTPSEARSFLEQRLAPTGIVFAPAHFDNLLARCSGHPGRLQRAAADLYRQIT